RGRRNEPRIPRPPQAGGEPAAQPSNDFGNSVANPRNGSENNEAATSGRFPRAPQVDRNSGKTHAPVDRGRLTDSAPVPQAERSVPRPADTGRPAQPQTQPTTPTTPEQRNNPVVERSVPRPSQIDRGPSVDRAPRVNVPSQVQRSVPRPAEGMRMSQPDAQTR